MGKMEKRIFDTKTELQTYLTSLGFTIANNKMTWDNDTNTNNCYWTVANDGVMNFYTSTGTNAFYYNIVDFSNNQCCGVIFIELSGGGCILYLTPLPQNYLLSNFTLNCANNYDTSYVKIPGQDLQNGLVVCTPAEDDNKWRYSWRDKDPTAFAWTIDNTVDQTLRGVEIPMKKMLQAAECATLTKVMLNSGIWSHHIYDYVLGDPRIPGTIFKINGQKYITVTDNLIYRSPAFRLSPDTAIINPTNSTQEYSENTLYAIGDYCIYEGLLYKCINAITTPKAFDSNDWIVTTVYNEIN